MLQCFDFTLLIFIAKGLSGSGRMRGGGGGWGDRIKTPRQSSISSQRPHPDPRRVARCLPGTVSQRSKAACRGVITGSKAAFLLSAARRRGEVWGPLFRHQLRHAGNTTLPAKGHKSHHVMVLDFSTHSFSACQFGGNELEKEQL